MNPVYLGVGRRIVPGSFWPGIHSSPHKHTTKAFTKVIACGDIIDGWNLLAVDVCSTQPVSLHAMNATGSTAEEQLEEGEADTVQLLYLYPGLSDWLGAWGICGIKHKMLAFTWLQTQLVMVVTLQPVQTSDPSCCLELMLLRFWFRELVTLLWLLWLHNRVGATVRQRWRDLSQPIAFTAIFNFSSDSSSNLGGAEFIQSIKPPPPSHTHPHPPPPNPFD